MQRYCDLVFTDPFILSHPVTEYLAEQLDADIIKVASLFGNALADDPLLNQQLSDGTVSYFSVFFKIVTKAVSETSRSVIIPDHPRFFESRQQMDDLLAQLRGMHVPLAACWYVQNTDIPKTIEQSLIMRNHLAAYTAQPEKLNAVITNANSVQQLQRQFMARINERYPVHYIQSNSIKELPEATKAQINGFLAGGALQN